MKPQTLSKFGLFLLICGLILAAFYPSPSAYSFIFGGVLGLAVGIKRGKLNND